MLKQILAGTAAVAAMGIATSAMAGEVDFQTYEVFVNIEVANEVSMWAGHENVNLVMDGSDPDSNNTATFESTISHINNVAATISANVDGVLPAPIVTGGGINFFIFDDSDDATARAAIFSGAYSPAGAKVWNYDNLGTTQEITDVAVATSIDNRNIVYASNSPGEIPLPDNFDLTVTWTIAEATP